MAELVARRLLVLPVVWLGVSVLVFLMLHLTPGDPALVIAGPDAPPEVVARIRRELGLDRPLMEQYARYLGRVLQGDLGRSPLTHVEVREQVLTALPRTLQLALAAALLSPLLALPLGVVAAARRGRPLDAGLMLGSMVGITMPTFAVGLLLIWLVADRWRLLPVSGYGGPLWTPEGLRSLILPAVTLAAGAIAAQARLTRAALLDALSQEYIRVARAKGLGERGVLLRHALRNALLPLVTLVGLQVGTLLGGAVVTETVFAWPGLGRLAITAIQARDLVVVQGVVLVVASLVVLVNLIVDLLYLLVDPCIRYG